MSNLRQGTPSLCGSVSSSIKWGRQWVPAKSLSWDVNFPLPGGTYPLGCMSVRPRAPQHHPVVSFRSTTLWCRCRVGSSQQLWEGGGSQKNRSSGRTQLAVVGSCLPPPLLWAQPCPTCAISQATEPRCRGDWGFYQLFWIVRGKGGWERVILWPRALGNPPEQSWGC